MTARFDTACATMDDHARQLIAAWRDEYNHHRPHTSLDGLTPREYFNRSQKDQIPIRLNF
jgi:putative transposase